MAEDLFSRFDLSNIPKHDHEPQHAFMEAYGLGSAAGHAAALSEGNTRLAKVSTGLKSEDSEHHSSFSFGVRDIFGFGGATAAYAFGGSLPFMKAAFPAESPLGTSGVALSLGVLGLNVAHAGYDIYGLATGKKDAGRDLCMDLGGVLGAGASLWMARGIGGGFGLGFRTMAMGILGEMGGASLYHMFDHDSKER